MIAPMPTHVRRRLLALLLCLPVPAFAAQTVADGRELGFDWSKVNVNGGAIALGHPIGASGARIVATLLHELRRREGRYGLATLCLGGGGSVAAAFERV